MTPPWKKKRPTTSGPKQPLTEAEKTMARARAAQAGRRYPNLVDNLWVLSLRKKGVTATGSRPKPDRSR